jgi:DNA polymerase-1
VPELVVLVDGNSILYRTYFALPALLTSDGYPTGGVYGLTNILFKLLEETKPDWIFFTFDLKGPTFRHLDFADYKANRPKAPSDLVQQLALAHELAEALCIPVFERPGFEADDMIATLTSKAVTAGKQVVILTGDLDTLQLVSDAISVVVPRKGISETTTYDLAAVRKRYGLEPRQLVDYKALVGDPSDNIPRIPQMGEKTVGALLAKFGSLAELYQQLEHLEPRLRTILVENRTQVEQNKFLTQLVSDIDLSVDWNSLRFSGFQQEKARALFSRLEFKTLLRKLAPPPAIQDDTPQRALEDWRPTALPLVFALTEEKPPHLALADQNAVFVGELGGGTSSGLFDANPTLPEPIRRSLVDVNRPKWTHDGKTARKMLATLGLPLAGVSFDTLLASYLINSGRSSHNLDQIHLEKLKRPLWQEGEEFGPRERAVLIAQAVLRLTPLLEEDLITLELMQLFREVELPLSDVLAEMEQTGVRLSRRVLEELRQEAEVHLASLEKEIFDQCGCRFNISSPKQLAVVLFEKLQLAKGRKTKTGYSTDAAVLESLAFAHPAVARILEYRELFKLKTTYIDALPGLLDPNDRVHTTYLQTSTTTGRLSSVNPNLQNIPIRSAFGQQIRRAFIASSGSFLLSADYSQIELRVLAHLSRDPDLLEVFARDGDVHTDTACHVFNVSPEQVTSDMRRMAKAINFGIIYGMSPYGLAQATGAPVGEAAVYIDRYFAQHAQARQTLENILKQGRKYGFVSTILGRKRFIPDLNSSNRRLAQMAERAALNAPIQGSAADILKLAMLKLHRALKEKQLKSRIVLTVHDELVLDCLENERDTVVPLVRYCMESAYPLAVPLKTELKIGWNWSHMEKV